jgi:hypothetical protein
MALTIKLLAHGSLPSTTGDLYVVPGTTKAIIKTLKVVNTDSSTRTINLYAKPSGQTARRIVPVNMELGAGYMGVEDEELTLGAGDAIQGDCSVAGVVDYTVYGVEETA